jgi:hypothetical protein
VRRYNPSVFALLGVLLYVSRRQIHEDLGVPNFTDHIRALTVSFVSKLAEVRNRYYGNPLPEAKAKDGRGQQASIGHR